MLIFNSISFFFLKINSFIYLTGLGLSCLIQDLSLQRKDSLVLALGLLITGAPLASLAWAPEHRLSSCGAQA